MYPTYRIDLNMAKGGLNQKHPPPLLITQHLICACANVAQELRLQTRKAAFLFCTSVKLNF